MRQEAMAACAESHSVARVCTSFRGVYALRHISFCLPYLVISCCRNFFPMGLRMDPNGKAASASIAIHLTEHSEIYQTCCPFHGASSDYIYVRNHSFHFRLETYRLPAGNILLLPQLRVTAGTAVAESIRISLKPSSFAKFQ